MKLIERPHYMNKLLAAAGTPDIKVITGIRRSGKSKLLEALADHIRQHEPTANIIRINFNLLEFEPLAEYYALNTYVEEHFVSEARNILMIDEVQICKGFERTINSLHASEKYDIYVTGSNAFLLSSDLATLFTGRTVEIEVFPFSLEEFSRYHDITVPDVALDRYLREGGMPGSYLYASDQARYAYINDILQTLILRDIKQKYRIRKSEQLVRASNFLMDNIGNITSASNMVDGLRAAGFDVSDKTLSAYLGYFRAAFAFYTVSRYDIAGKQYLSSGEKFYLADHSFRYAALGTKHLDYGRVYENMVAIELMRRGWEVYVGTLYKKEVDFVAVQRDKRVYIQVSDDISQEKTRERELAPLMQIRDSYPKMLIAHTRHESVDYDGIKVVDLARWLLGKE